MERFHFSPACELTALGQLPVPEAPELWKQRRVHPHLPVGKVIVMQPAEEPRLEGFSFPQTELGAGGDGSQIGSSAGLEL